MNKKFILGADVSSLPAMEDYGAKFYDFDGEEKDALHILKSHGIDYIRLRIWNDPDTSFDRGDYCNLENTIEIAKRVKQTGLKLLLDFHYCDTWADWKTQTIPRKWQGQSFEELCESVYQYTKEVLETLYRAGAYPEIVQIGNEIGKGLLWDFGTLEKPQNIVSFLNKGIQAVTDAKTGENRAAIMLHIEGGGNVNGTENFFKLLEDNRINYYDYIGLSYYPYWAGDYQCLIDNMRNIKKKFGKEVIVVETAFPYTDKSNDDMPNVVTGELTVKEMNVEPSQENQRKVIEKVIQTVYEEDNGSGVFYWEPVWYCVKGVGVSKGYGNEWENQAMFDNNGKALDGLRAFECINR